jgi:hypothetical protein
MSFHSTPEDVSLLSERLGVTAIRLTLKPRQRAERKKITPEAAWKETLTWTEAMLDACKENNITAIVSLSDFPFDPGLGLTEKSPDFWSNNKHLEDVVEKVREITIRFKGRGSELGAYHILNEPSIRSTFKTKRPQKWPELLNKIILTIRAEDTNRWVVVTPGPGGMPSSYEGFQPLGFKLIIYGAHMYTPHNYTYQGIRGRTRRGKAYPGVINDKEWNKASLKESLSELRDFEEKNNAVIWLGEFSAVRWAPGAEDYLKDIVSIFNEYEWGWSYFCYKCSHVWDPDFDTGFATNKKKDFEAHRVGVKSSRWQTLFEIFNVQHN